jgi:hypothetical protein
MITGALVGPDLWFEAAVHNKIFISEALVQAIIEIGLGDAFKFQLCRLA